MVDWFILNRFFVCLSLAQSAPLVIGKMSFSSIANSILSMSHIRAKSSLNFIIVNIGLVAGIWGNDPTGEDLPIALF